MSYTSVAVSPSVASSDSVPLRVRLRGHLAMAVAALTLLVAAGGLILTHTETRPVIPKGAALRAVLANSGVSRMLAATHWDHADVTPMDSHYEELGFYRGARVVATVTVGRSRGGLFIDATDLTHEKYAYGSNIGNDTRVLAGLAIVFVLMTAVWPLWRLRNLDALVAAATALSVVLLNRWTLTRMVLFSYPAMIYLALRCAIHALAPPGCRPSAVPLYDHLTRRWPTGHQVRILRVLAAALAVITVMVGFTSLHVLDVGYAVMEGATDIAHGVLPYGHIPDILHGDTYPIGSYLLYAPLAAAWPVHTVWDDADATLVVAAAAALLAAAGVWRMASRPGGSTAGARTAVAVLAFPPLLVTVSTGTTDVVLAALLVVVLLLWHRPVQSAAALSLAAWFKASPVLLVPLLLARLGRRALLGALTALGAVSAAMLGVLVALGGLRAVGRMLSAVSFQFTRSSPHTLWALTGSVPLQQLSEAATLALVAGAAVKLRRDPVMAGDRSRLAALVAAVLLSVQIAASYWNYMYLIWALPFLALGLFVVPARDAGPHVITEAVGGTHP